MEPRVRIWIALSQKLDNQRPAKTAACLDGAVLVVILRPGGDVTNEGQ